MITQIIYYDHEDDTMDGHGWNIVDTTEGAVALRFHTLREARSWCVENGYPFIVDKQTSRSI